MDSGFYAVTAGDLALAFELKLRDAHVGFRICALAASVLVRIVPQWSFSHNNAGQ
jgi:hypothetical protein